MINRALYNEIIKEYFDLDHDETRKVLVNIDEADQNMVLNTLTSKLYDNIVDKVDDIDYGNIPETKGDITKLENYEKLADCIVLMEELLVEFKQDPKPVKIVHEALNNIIERKDIFERAFALNIELPIVLYCTISLSIVSSISFLISNCVEFIKSPAQDDFDLIIDKMALAKSKQNLLFTNLEKFNKSCSKGEVDKCLEYIIKSNVQNLTGMEIGVVGGVALVALLINIIPILRELIFFFYYSRTRVSDYLDIQADLLQMNAYNIKNNNSLNKAERDKISKKQLKIVDIYRKLSNKLAIEVKQAEVKSTREIASDNKQYKTNELLSSVPDSAGSSLF